MQCFSPGIYADFGFDIKEKQILMPKSTQHFYGGFSEVSSHLLYMAALGAVALDMKAIDFKNLDTSNLYPWVENFLGSK